MRYKLAELATALKARVVGDQNVEVDAVATFETADTTDLVFVSEEKYLPAAMASKAAAVLAGDFAANAAASKPLLIARHPKLAFARAAAMLVPRRRWAPGVHSTAIVHHSAKISKSATVQPHAVITEDVEIGEGTRIGPGTAVGTRAKIGGNCNIAANVTIYPRTTIGNNVVVHAGAVLGADGFGYVRDPESGRYEQFPQLGTLVIEDDVEIGANATIDRGALGITVIRRGTKIDNMVHIGHNCDIGEDVVIAGQTGISGSVVIENGAVIGGQVGIGDHVRIGEGVILGAQAGVPTSKVLRGRGEVFWGTPARPIKEVLKGLAALARLSKNHSR